VVSFHPEDKVLVNRKHAEGKTLKDIGRGNFEAGIAYTEDNRFESVIYPSWKYDLATDALRCKVSGIFRIFRVAHPLASEFTTLNSTRYNSRSNY
jgi:hypothetical protein